MSRLLSDVGSLIDRIRINAIERAERGGRAVWLKTRRPWAALVIPVANAFFRLAGNPIRILAGTKWQRWEAECLVLLHGGEFCCGADGPNRMWTDEIPGVSLSHHLDAGTFTAEMFAAAARELRRAHALDHPGFAGVWSHGDPHTGNLLIDERGRARLMDFEVRHYARLSAETRRADDLLVFLQDTLGRMDRERWLPLATHFVRSYGERGITEALLERLSIPGGIGRVWWAVRTTYLRPRELEGRLLELRSALAV
jgi:hypothetical protein